MHTIRTTLRAAVVLLLGLGAAHADQGAPVPDQGFVSLIDQGGFQPGRAYRITPFVEFQQVGSPELELSTPFIPARFSQNVAGTQVYEWSRFQDRVKYASITGLNNSLVPGPGSPEDLYFTNCVLQLPADISIAIKQGLTGVGNLKLDLPAVEVSDTRNNKPYLPDNVGLYGRDKKDGNERFPTLAPRVPREEYCQDSSLNPVPDVPFIYAPGIQTCAFGGCISTPGFPNPLYINWPGLAERMREACQSAAKSYIDVYQKNIAEALLKNMPLAVNWDGVLNLHTSGANVRSGVTMSPVIGESTMVPSALKAAQSDPRFAAYFALPYKNISNGFVPGVGSTANTAGISSLEELKRTLDPGTLGEQEEHGYTTLFQTWQTLDTVLDVRPSIYWASSVTCVLFAGCVPTPLPLTAPDTVVAGPACAVPNPGTMGAGTTTFSELRYHHAYVSVPESYPIPGLVGNAERTAPLRLPGQD